MKRPKKVKGRDAAVKTGGFSIVELIIALAIAMCAPSSHQVLGNLHLIVDVVGIPPRHRLQPCEPFARRVRPENTFTGHIKTTLPPPDDVFSLFNIGDFREVVTTRDFTAESSEPPADKRASMFCFPTE